MGCADEMSLAEMVLRQSGKAGCEREGLRALIGEKGIQPEDLYIPGGAPDNDQLGAAVLSLITDWSWVRRRVESVQIITEGQTRRQISLDFVLPKDSGLQWRPTEAHYGVAVPLTFLRKGVLVDLDLSDRSGNSLPSLTTSENAQLTYNAMRLVSEELQLDESAEELFGDLGRRLKLATFQRLEDQEAVPVTWRNVINRAIYDVVMSSGYDPDAVDYQKIDRLQEVHRHDLFALSAQMCALAVNKVSTSGAGWPESLTMSTWLLGYNMDNAPEPTSCYPEVLDSSVSVQVLECVLFHEIQKSQEDQGKLQRLEVLCQLLAITSISYLFTVVMDEDDIWPNGFERRSLVKLKCDVEISEQYYGSKINKICHWGWQMIRRWILFYPYTETPIRYSNWSASSTHLEFVPPANTSVRRIRATQGKPLQEAQGTDDPHALATRKIILPEGKNIDGKKGEPNEYRHGSYRTSQGRVHVTRSKEPVQPLDSLLFCLAPRVSGQPLLAAISALIFTGIAMVIVGRQQNGLEDRADAAWFDFSVFVALETLILALFGTLLLTSGRHRVSKKVWAGPQSLIIVATLVAVFAPIFVLPGSWGSEQTGEERRELPWVFSYNGLLTGLWVCVAVAIYLLGCALVTMYLCRDDATSLVQEKIIEEEFKEKHRHRPYHNVVAVTETGAGHCNYMTDDFIRSYGIADSVSAHRATLGKIAKQMAEKLPEVEESAA